MLQTERKNEIFRHLRPQWYDSTAHSILPQKNGGISVLLLPTSDGEYSYWIYICPLDAEFSTKVAVKNLRDRVEKGVVPWGKVVLTDEPIVLQVLKSIMNEKHDSSDVSKMALEIMISIWAAESKKQLRRGAASALAQYSEA